MVGDKLVMNGEIGSGETRGSHDMVAGDGSIVFEARKSILDPMELGKIGQEI